MIVYIWNIVGSWCALRGVKMIKPKVFDFFFLLIKIISMLNIGVTKYKLVRDPVIHKHKTELNSIISSYFFNELNKFVNKL